MSNSRNFRSPAEPPSDSADFDDQLESPARQRSGNSGILKAVLGRWPWIVLGLLVGLLGAAYYLAKAPSLYTATTTLLIKQRTGSVIGQDKTEEISMSSSEGLNTVAERIRRMDLLERVTSRQDIREEPGIVPPETRWLPQWAYPLLNRKDGRENTSGSPPAVPSPAALAGMLAGRMDIAIRRGTRLLDITFTHEVPEAAKALADGVAREYLAEIAVSRSTERSSSMELLIQESMTTRIKLQAASNARALYARALELHRTLETQEAKMQVLTGRYRAKHPDMIAGVRDLADLQTRFLQEFEAARLAPTEADYWKNAGAVLDAADRNQQQRLFAARQSLLARDQVLASEITSQNAVFQSMLTQIQNSTVNQKGNESEAGVSSLARVPDRASSPNSNKILGTGSMAGIAAGLALALLLARLDNKIHTVAQLEELCGASVLAAISHIPLRTLEKSAREFEKQSRKKNQSSRPISPLCQNWNPRLLFQAGLSNTMFAEQFRALRASISLLGDEARRGITLFTSAVPGEGKSMIAANFALASAAQGRRTLLLDLDLRKPSQHRLFNLPRAVDAPPHPGMTECLASQSTLAQSIVDETGHENLHIIFAGQRAPNAGELLNAPRLVDLLREAALHYDVIVIDSAPLLAVPDTRLIAPHAHNVCLVVRAEQVPKGAVLRSLDILDSSGTPASGLVLNDYREKRGRMGSNYSYGSYQSYGYGSNASTYGYGSET